MSIFNKLVCLLVVLTLNSTSSFAFLGSDQKRFIEDEKNTVSVFENNVRSVVNVSNMALVRRGLFDMNTVEVPRGAGSGFVWDVDGHIVTNFHVIQGGSKFMVSFHGDKKSYKAKIVGVLPEKDIAVLKLEEKPSKLYPLKKGKSKTLMVGQKAMAIGNPFGLDHTITSGIISALGRKIMGIGNVTIQGMIQTDASINPGNSGGPLLDSSGQLIGMNTVIYSKSGSSAGVGFAVPVDTIKRVVPQLIKDGKITRPGLSIQLLSDYQKARIGVERGLVIAWVDKNGPAAKAGLNGFEKDSRGRVFMGDIILEIDGQKVNNYDDIYQVLDEKNIGDVVEVKYLRGKKKKSVKVKLNAISAD